MTDTFRCTACGHSSTTTDDGSCELCGGTLERVAATQATASTGPARLPGTQDAYHLPNRPLDEVASLILDLLFAHGGSIEDDPGRLLLQIAELVDTNYFGVAVAVRQLERIGFIQVARHSGEEAYQGNRITSIHVV